jgi:16S rRNA G527 N7-methylase RsmG
LADATRKKVVFLNHIGRILRLEHFRTLHLRAERTDLRRIAKGSKGSVRSVARPPEIGNEFVGIGPERFRFVISRALAVLKDLVLMARPLLENGGVLLAMKGPLYEKELIDFKASSSAAAELQGRGKADVEIALRHYRLPVLGGDRAILQIRFAHCT